MERILRLFDKYTYTETNASGLIAGFVFILIYLISPPTHLFNDHFNFEEEAYSLQLDNEILLIIATVVTVIALFFALNSFFFLAGLSVMLLWIADLTTIMRDNAFRDVHFGWYLYLVAAILLLKASERKNNR